MQQDTTTAAPPKVQQRTGRTIPLRRKLAYTAVCVGMVLVLAEAGLRVRAWIRYGTVSPVAQNRVYTYDTDLKLTVPIPGRELHGTRINVKINSLGFRGEEFSKDKPPNTLRIACVGASTTYCPEVSSNDATWPAQLQTLLRARFPDIRVEVINAGIQGIKSSDSLKNLRYRVLPLEPDLVIFYESHNDIVWDTREIAKQQGLIDDEAGRQSGLLGFLSEKSLLVNLVTRNITIALANRDSNRRKLTTIPPDLPQQFIGQLQAMHELLSERQISFVLSRFLVRFRRDQPRATQLANAEIAFVYLPWMSLDSLLDSFDLYNDAIVQFAHSQGIPVVEDQNMVPGDAANYVDHVHMSDAGCEAMARRFAQFFEQQKILEPIVAKIKNAPR
jgi:lysophospholipase L1-like esterase